MSKVNASGLHPIERAPLGEIPIGDGDETIQRLGILLQFEEEESFDDLYKEAREFVTLEHIGVKSLRTTSAGTFAVSGALAPLNLWTGGLPCVELPAGAGVLATTPDDRFWRGAWYAAFHN